MALPWIVTEPTADVAFQVSDILTNLSDLLTHLSETLTKLSYLPSNLSYLSSNLSYLPANLSYLPTNLGDRFSVAVDPVSQPTLHRTHVGSDEPVEASERRQQHDELSPVLHPVGPGGCPGCIGIGHVSCLRWVLPNLARNVRNRHSVTPVNSARESRRWHRASPW